MDQDHTAAQRYLDELRRHLTRLPQAEREQRPPAVCREIAQGDRSRQRGTDHEHAAEPLEHVTQTPSERRREHAHGRAGAQHEPQLRRWQPTHAQEGWEKGRGDAKGRVQRGIQQQEAGQCGRPGGLTHGASVS